MSCSVLHHIEICVKEEKQLLSLLTKGFGFLLFAHRHTPQASKWALKSGTSVFVIVKRTQGHGNLLTSDGCPTETCMNAPSYAYEEPNCNSLDAKDVTSTNNSFKGSRTDEQGILQDGESSTAQDQLHPQGNEHWTTFCCGTKPAHTIDSVFNVALVVKDVGAVTERVRSKGGQVLREATVITDEMGEVTYSIVTSCCGNIVHTLIDKRKYKGDFLPGFDILYPSETHTQTLSKAEMALNGSSSSCEKESDLNGINTKGANSEGSSMYQALDKGAPISDYIDHVTYVCDTGKSSELISWYENCFGMKRFMTNSAESETDGFVLGGSIGLRLKALEYWRCAEVGLALPSASMTDSSLKLVIAEALEGVSESHVNTFLREHQGPGVQHIGLHTSTMTATVQYMADRGVVFRKPPPVYYQEGIKFQEIQEAGHSHEVEEFKKLGILLDTEQDVFTDIEEQGNKNRYLMQVFTKPVFGEDTFFLEIIQRCGAKGFGAGNITALAKSIILYRQQLENGDI